MASLTSFGSDPGRKTYRAGTHRVVAPGDTVARVEPLKQSMGITRLANVTGLDRIGLPVVMVCRPNARSIAVAQGKGLDLAAAKASGLMEAAEAYHAEAITLPLRLCSYRELVRSHRVIDVTGLPRSVENQYDDRRPMLWIEGRDLMTDSGVWLPFELVSADYTLPLPPGSGCFAATTNGLASGNHLLEAISHGIFEVIERDATTLWRLRGEQGRSDRVLDLDSVDDPACREVLARLAAAEVDVRVWETTSDAGVAAFVCLIMGRTDQSADPEFGAGCHPAREIALLRALTEAAQARMTYITGSRDDFAPDLYAPAIRAARLSESRAWISAPGAARAFGAVPTWDGDTIEDDVAEVLRRLQAVGIEQVAVVDLTKPELGLPVVRVVIPGLEGPYQGASSDYVPGRRGLALIGDQA